MSRRWVPLVLVVTLAAGAYSAADPVSLRLRERDLARMVPDLDPEVRRHLLADSDDAWLAHCRRIGTGPLAEAYQALRLALQTASYTEFLERREPVLEASSRVGRGFSEVYGFNEPRLVVEFERSLPPARDFELHQLDVRYATTAADTSRTPEERLRIVDAVAREYRARGEPYRALVAELAALPIELETGRVDRHRARLEAVLASARRLRQPYVHCQVLGQLGVVHWQAGHEDSMRACFDEGIATALRHGLLDQASRLLVFHAAYHAGQGRLALSLDRLAEAQRLCDEPGGQSARLRQQLEYAKLVARLGCWDLVDRSLRSVPPLLREHPRAGRQDEAEKYSFDADLLDARLAFATGNPERGSALMRKWESGVPAMQRRVAYAELLNVWSAGLEAAGRASESLDLCERGLVHCDSAHVPEHVVPLLMRKARLLTRLGLFHPAAMVLDSAEAAVLQSRRDDGQVRTEVGVARARLLHRQGLHAKARREVERTYRDFRLRLRQGDTGALSPLELEHALSLRDAQHEIAAFTPADGYRFELEWRSLSKVIGHERRRRASHGERARGAASAPETGVLPAGGTHLVYHFLGDALLRWTATPGRVVRDTLPISASQCLQQVREVLALLQVEIPPPGNFLGPRARARLERLAEILLPRLEEQWPSRNAPVYVSADGPLQALPFEALPVRGPRGPEPLAWVAEVAYVNGWDGFRSRGRGRVVVVSNPKLSPDLQRRHGGIRWLRGSAAETQAVLARWPDAQVLSGDQATKKALQGSLPGASILYLAAHHVRDPDAPFLGFIPLATSPGAPAEAAFIEIADIHELDLSECRIAVLASCASGAPYRLAVRPGPSLGDAFLDSGAAAVVQSFWDVGDLETSTFMDAFLATWSAEGSDIASLARARRAIMARPEGGPPRVWAAWSIKVARPGAASGAPVIASARHAPRSRLPGAVTP